MTAQRDDPFLSFIFTVEIPGIAPTPVAGFNEVSGLALEMEVETFREGGANYSEVQLPGPTKYPSRLTLKRGLGKDALWLWYQKATERQIQRKEITIVLMDTTGQPQRTWSFADACPIKWTGPTLKAGSAEVAFETIELIHKGLVPK